MIQDPGRLAGSSTYLLKTESAHVDSQHGGAAYDLSSNFSVPPRHHLPAVIPLTDRLVFTNAVERKLGRAYAGPLASILSSVTPKVYYPKKCCNQSGLASRLGNGQDPDRLTIAPPSRRRPWFPRRAFPLPDSIKKVSLPKFCKHGQPITTWTLRYKLPRLPGFPEYVTPTIKIIVRRKFPFQPEVVNHFYEVVLNLTRLLQVHVRSRFPRCRLWFPKPLHDDDRMTNVLLFSSGYATLPRLLSHLEELQGVLLAQIVNNAMVQYRQLLDRARAEDTGLSQADPVARLKLVEIYQDTLSASPSIDIQKQLAAARQMVSPLTHYTEPGYEGGYGLLRPQAWIKIYRKTATTFRQELFMGSKGLRRPLRAAPALWPATTASVREILDTVTWRYLEIAEEIDVTRTAGPYDPAAALDWSLLFNRIGIRPEDHEVARQLILDHHNISVRRDRYDKHQKKILKKFCDIGAYAFNCKGKKGVGRFIPGVLRAALGRSKGI